VEDGKTGPLKELGNNPSTVSSYLDFFLGAAFFLFAGLLLPNDPLNRFPFAVFLSPLPIV
jgi:hypothetical protein